MRALWTGLIAAVSLALPAAPGEAAKRPPHLFVFLSHAGGAEFDRLEAAAGCLDVVAPNWHTLETRRGTVSRHTPDPAVVRATRRAGAELWPVANAQFEGSAGALASATARDRIVRELAGAAYRYDYDGVTLDIEGVPAELRNTYTRLVRRAEARLQRQGRSLAVYVPRRTAAAPVVSAAAYDWNALADAADLVLASGYNEHYRAGKPGPVTTSVGFAEMLAYASSASRRNVVPTIAGFGYQWPWSGGLATLVPAAVAVSSPYAALATQDDGEISYLTPDGVVWSETTAGMASRAAAAAESGFRWLGLFTIGREPRDFWSSIGC